MPEKMTTVGEAFGPILQAPGIPTPGRDPTITTVGEAFGRKKTRDISATEAEQPLFNAVESFNERLAVLLAAPAELVNRGLRSAGITVLKSAEGTAPAPGDITRAVIEAFEAIGINSTPVEGLSREIGGGFFDGMVALAALTAAAPAVIANTASKSTLTQKVANDFARFFIERPGITVAAEAGAATGGPIGKRVLGPEIGEPVGALTGAVATGGVVPAVRIMAKNIPVVAAATVGAVTGGVAAGPTGAVGLGGLAGFGTRRVVRAAERGAERLLGRAPRIEPEPVFQEPRPGVATSAAAEVAEADLAVAERQIVEIMAKLPERTAAEASTELRAGLDGALRVARAQESKAFTEEFLSETATAEPLVEAAQGMLKRLKKASPATPTEQLTRIIAEFTKRAPSKEAARAVREKLPGRVVPTFVRGVKEKIGRLTLKEVTAREIQAFRSDILNAARNNAAGPNPSRGMVRNLNILADAALDSLRQVDEIAANNALKISQRLNTLFFRGPVGRVMRRTAAGETTVPPEAAAETLARRPAGFAQIEPIAEEFGVEELKPLTLNAVRALFREAAEQGGKPAQAFLRKNKAIIESFADEAIKLQSLADDLVAAETARLGAQRGALAKFAAADPQVGVRQVFSSANPARTAKEIVGRLDDEAAAGFRNEILAELFRRNAFSPQRLQADLAAGKTLRLIEGILPQKTLTRLRKIVDIAVKVETGELRVPGVGLPVLGPVLGLISRFVGAGIGRRVAGITGQQPTIQQTGAGATFAKSFMQRLTGKIDPADAFALSVTNPEFEALMLTKVPATARGLQDFNRSIRALIGTEAAARAAINE